MPDERSQPAPVRNVVIGQIVDEAKIDLAKKFRREMTCAEKRLWQHLRANRLAGLHFRRQQVIDGLIVVQPSRLHSAGETPAPQMRHYRRAESLARGWHRRVKNESSNSSC